LLHSVFLVQKSDYVESGDEIRFIIVIVTTVSEKICDGKKKTFLAIGVVFAVVDVSLDQTNITARFVIRGGAPDEPGVCDHNRGHDN